jgi:hypothetical protein
LKVDVESRDERGSVFNISRFACHLGKDFHGAESELPDLIPKLTREAKKGRVDAIVLDTGD